MTILDYLKEKYPAKTAQSYYTDWCYFTKYLEDKNIGLRQVESSLVLEYVHHLQAQLKPQSINRRLHIIEQIYQYLLPQSNPVQGFRVKTKGVKPLAQPLKVEQLEKILWQLPTQTAGQRRSQVLLSLVHYQALRTGEIKALKVGDIDLSKAIIQVPKVSRAVSRQLSIDAKQMLLLYQYIHQDRPFLKQYKTNQLVLTGGSSSRLDSTISRLQKQLKKSLPSLQNLAHWRSSILVHWLESIPLLEVKELAGHQYASSTEKYRLSHLKGLQQQLKEHHPLD